MLDIIDGLTYDDLLLIPKYSTLNSRSEVDLSMKIQNKSGDLFTFNLPIIPANMLSIATLALMKVVYENKGLALFHRFIPFKEQLEVLQVVKSWVNGLDYIGFSVGIQNQDYKYVDTFVKEGVKILCIDVANCACDKGVKLIQYIAKTYPHILLIAGTVGMGQDAGILWRSGADMVRAGIGNGSICLTRIATGCGVPSITSIDSCATIKYEMENELNRKLYLIADGGMKKVADVCLALAVGADFTILGNMFSGCNENITEIIQIDGEELAIYAGSSTLKATHKEGVKGAVKLKGSAQSIIDKICEGLRSCCSYQNVRNVIDLKKEPKFIKVSANGLKENGAHSLDYIL